MLLSYYYRLLSYVIDAISDIIFNIEVIVIINFVVTDFTAIIDIHILAVVDVINVIVVIVAIVSFVVNDMIVDTGNSISVKQYFSLLLMSKTFAVSFLG